MFLQSLTKGAIMSCKHLRPETQLAVQCRAAPLSQGGITVEATNHVEPYTLALRTHYSAGFEGIMHVCVERTLEQGLSGADGIR
mmetsp:Transcript_6151/g.22625  ORF Transcript_6151/g.22625 Transcript_6151/m.22625 type:complete len:84 (+) Transcript_6151:2323-2574(+)